MDRRGKRKRKEKAKGITVLGEDVEVQSGGVVADGEIISDNG